MTKRKYSEEEVREIFALATTRKIADPAGSPATNGLTLSEIQSIGQEVGLEPAAVARAAAALDTRTSKSARKSLGMPVGVGRIVPLPRALTDREWEQLVAELRSTFGARGQVGAIGSLREWSNGNLHVCVEPGETGYRLRMGTFKGDALALNAIGATAIAAGTVAFASLAISGGLTQGFFAPWLISAAGVGAFVTNFVRLPRWSRQREQQMDDIAARVQSMIADES